jgi:hypothetical protein
MILHERIKGINRGKLKKQHQAKGEKPAPLLKLDTGNDQI